MIALHICMVSSGVYPILPNRIGAIEPYVYGLAKNLATTNSVDLFGVGSGDVTEGNLHVHAMPYVQNFQLSLSKILDWRLAYYAPFNSYLVKNIFQLHMKNPIDIIHIHEIYAGFGATISKLSLGIPYVCSIHNEIRTTMPIFSCDKTLAVSSYIENFLIKQRKLDNSKVCILNVAIDIEAYSSTKSREQAKKELGLENRKIVLFVGRKCPEKGPQTLIEAIPKIVHANSNALAIFVGPDYFFEVTQTPYTKFLTAKAEKIGVSKNVVFTGHLPDEAKKLHYIAADVFVCPSIWQEPSSTVIKEALSLGKPVVATNVGGISDIITHGYNGLLVPPSDPDNLANAINHLLAYHEYAEKLGKNGRRDVEERFNFRTVSKDCLKIYDQVIKSK